MPTKSFRPETWGGAPATISPSSPGAPLFFFVRAAEQRRACVERGPTVGNPSASTSVDEVLGVYDPWAVAGGLWWELSAGRGSGGRRSRCEPCGGARVGGATSGGTVVIPIVDNPIFNPHHPNHFVESVISSPVFQRADEAGRGLQPGPTWPRIGRSPTMVSSTSTSARTSSGTTVNPSQPPRDVRFTFMEVVLNPDVAAGSSPTSTM